MAVEQFRMKAEFQRLRGSASGLQLQLVNLPGLPPACILCDISQATPRPLVLSIWTDKIVSHFHGISHAGGRSTLREIKDQVPFCVVPDGRGLFGFCEVLSQLSVLQSHKTCPFTSILAAPTR